MSFYLRIAATILGCVSLSLGLSALVIGPLFQLVDAEAIALSIAVIFLAISHFRNVS